MHAIEEATKDRGLSAAEISGYNTAFIGASTVGDICLTDEMYGDPKIGMPISPFINSYDLEAAGAIEAVYCILNLMEQKLYPEINFKNTILGTELMRPQQYKEKSLSHIMSNSFDFRINCSSLIFLKV